MVGEADHTYVLANSLALLVTMLLASFKGGHRNYKVGYSAKNSSKSPKFVCCDSVHTKAMNFSENHQNLFVVIICILKL